MWVLRSKKKTTVSKADTTARHFCLRLLNWMAEILLLEIYTNIAINYHDTCCYLISLLFSCSPYLVLVHFCIFYYCDISCSCVWQLALYRNEMNVTIDTGVIVICSVYRLYISECVWHLLLIKQWNEMNKIVWVRPVGRVPVELSANTHIVRNL